MPRIKPIYQSAQEHWPLPPREGSAGHKGLWFTRFYDGFKSDWKVDETARSRWLKHLEGPCGRAETLRKTAQRRMELGDSLSGVSRAFKTQWHLVTGLGLPHPVENGFAWHPTLGTPYLCGAAVKGILRSWVKEYADLGEDERSARSKLWFGEPDRAGCLTFFDALPIRSPDVGLDVMTPHMGKWYEKGGKIRRACDARDVDPADWHSPVPVVFLVVRNASFLFTIAPRDKKHKSEAEAAMAALERALEEIGAGAKTAVGYGDMAPDHAAMTPLREAVREERAKKIARAEMSPLDRALAQVIDDAKRRNLAPEIALVQGLERGDWQGEEAILVARKAQAIMQEEGKWQTEEGKKSQRKRYKRTLIVQRILADSGSDGDS